MSESDTFINEVSDEVRRDRLYALLRKWGWVPVLAVVLLVGGAAYNEYQKSQTQARAQDLGDAMLSALQIDDSAGRIAALGEIETDSAGGQAVVAFLRAAEQVREQDFSAAATGLEAVANDGDLPLIYRQIAGFKALTIDKDKSSADRRSGFEALAIAGTPLRLMAQEQLAYIDIEDGNTDAAIEKLQRIVVDAEITAGLQRRVVQVIVALGAVPETSGQLGAEPGAATASE